MLMRNLHRLCSKQRGMTLIEVMVTMGLLSVLLIGTLTIYAQLFKAIQTRDNLMTVLHDADLIMSSIGNDIRNASAFLKDYQGNDSQKVIAAFNVRTRSAAQPAERVIVYALDSQHPDRLIRSVQTGGRVMSLELSRLVQQLDIAPTSQNVFAVQLLLKYTGTGKVNTWRTSSAFALRE